MNGVAGSGKLWRLRVERRGRREFVGQIGRADLPQMLLAHALHAMHAQIEKRDAAVKFGLRQQSRRLRNQRLAARSGTSPRARRG